MIIACACGGILEYWAAVGLIAAVSGIWAMWKDRCRCKGKCKHEQLRGGLVSRQGP